MFNRAPNSIDSLIPESQLVDPINVEEREEHIETQFEKTRDEVRYYNNLAAQKRIGLAERDWNLVKKKLTS